MVSLYVTSLEPGDGKTALCAGLFKRFTDLNKKVGFIKPVIAGPDIPGNGYVDPDVAFMQKLFSSGEISPAGNVTSPPGKMIASMQEATAALDGKKDVLIIEGMNINAGDAALGKLSIDLIKAIKTKVLLVCKYNKELSSERIKQGVSPVKDKLAGIVITAIPLNKVEIVRQNLTPALEKDGIKVLALVPEDRVLSAVSVADLAAGLQGQVLVNKDRLDEIAENLMIGAMTLESGKLYFGRKNNKVVIIRGERPDMMLASLHTSTVGIISTGAVKPSDSVLLEAEVRKVPIIAVSKPTREVTSSLESILAKARFRQEKKMERLADVLSKSLDFKALTKEMGLSI